MDAFRELLLKNETLLLFLVIGTGYLVGQIQIKGFRLGVAGVLFAGLIFGGWQVPNHPDFSISPQIAVVGLVLFVYVVGLSTGPGFFRILKKSGISFNLAVLVSLLFGAAITLLLGIWGGISIEQIAGVFCGSLSNTPALAAVTEFIKETGLGNSSDPTVGYSITYPFSIVGGLLAFEIFSFVYRKTLIREIATNHLTIKKSAHLVTEFYQVRNRDLFDKAIGELKVQDKIGLIISRVIHEQKTIVPNKYTVLHENDIVVAVGPKVNARKAVEYFGAKSPQRVTSLDPSLTVRMILMSRKELVGSKIAQLELENRFHAKITRLKRADVEMIPPPDTQIEIGDHLKVIVPVENASKIAEFFGDSERSMSALDYTALTLGISIGVLIGMIPIPLPGGTTISLGFAGGSLIAGLVLGRLGRTGPLTWSIPEESNQAIRHIGLLFFLAGVGITAGGQFFDALINEGLMVFGIGIVTTTITSITSLLLLKYVCKSSVISAMGATSGMQTQPATLVRAHEISRSDEAYIAYASTYPVAMVGKILIAQIIIILGHHLF